MRCLYAASEVAGFAKTGGLADVAASLPRALAKRGIECAVIAPLYRSVRTGPHRLEPTKLELKIPLGDRTVQGTIARTTLPGSKVPVFLIEQPEFFERDNPAAGQGIYQFTLPDGQQKDYPDNCARFVFFCRAVLEAIRLLDFWPDVLHVNDWHTGLVPAYLKESYQATGPRPVREKYRRVRTLITIHNMAHQGVFWHWDMAVTGLPWRLFNYEQLEFYGHLNLLKAGLVFSDLLSTVSPTYAREIQTPYFGFGLQGVLSQRKQDLFGIVNGVDYEVWDPANDQHLAARYDVKTLSPGKPKCKRALQEHFGLNVEARTPLFGLVSRLVDQKGLDLVGKVAENLLRKKTQLVVLGMGAPAYHEMLLKLREKYPRQVGVRLALDEKLAHQIEAGADAFLMPSQFEPCGLNQLYSLKYGTVPMVRAVGGLADTVVDASPKNLEAGTATGFMFQAYTPAAFLETIDRALLMYHENAGQWRKLQETGMRQDWSWNRSAAQYEDLYRKLVKIP